MNKSKGALLYMVMYVRSTARMPEHLGCFASLRSGQGQALALRSGYPYVVEVRSVLERTQISHNLIASLRGMW